MSSLEAPYSVLITGAAGNLGRKLISHLLERPWCRRIVAVDHVASPPSHWDENTMVEWIVADLSDPGDARWRNALREIDAAVHFAARNPYPDASWSDACASFDMTCNLLEGAAAAQVRRVVFISSNHVMGRYKDPPLADSLQPGGLTTDLPPGPGTRWFNGREIVQGDAYAVSKLMGERLCRAKAEASGGALSTVAVRIGWCQPGDNRPETINTSGLPGEEVLDNNPNTERDLRWFRNMWLSNRDFAAVMERALLADSTNWPAPGIVVNAMSANRGMPWDILTTRELIGYESQDDIWRELGSRDEGSGDKSA